MAAAIEGKPASKTSLEGWKPNGYARGGCRVGSLKNFLRGMETPSSLDVPPRCSRTSKTSLEGWKRGGPRDDGRRALASKTSLEGWKPFSISRPLLRPLPSKTSLEGWKRHRRTEGLHIGLRLKNFLRGMETSIRAFELKD